MERRVVVSKRNGMGPLGSLLALMVVLSGILILTAGVASASHDCRLDPYGNEVCPTEHERNFDPDVDAEVLTRPGTPPDDANGNETLPFTGADVTLFVITGAALIATGILVVRRTRASKSHS